MDYKLTYEAFLDRAPKETIAFMQKLLPLLSYYVADNHSVGSEYFVSDSEKSILLAIITASSYDSCVKPLLHKDGFRLKGVSCKPIDISLFDDAKFKMYFDALYTSVLPVERIDDLYTLYPDAIVSYLCSKSYGTNFLSSLFDNDSNKYDRFARNLDKQAKSQKEFAKKELAMDLFRGIDISVVNYLENASIINEKIRKLINSGESSKGLIVDQDDIDSLSMLMALFFQSNIASELFNSEGVNLDSISKITNMRISNSEVNSGQKDINLVVERYKKFLFCGVNEGVSPEDITVESIARNLLDRELGNSLIIEKIISACKGSFDSFNDFESRIQGIYNKKLSSAEIDNKKSFYKDLNNQVIQKMEFVAKVYEIIMRQMAEGKHNSDVLVNEDDADTLALLISGFFFDNDVIQFFISHNITLDGILDYLNIQVTPEMVEKEDLEFGLLVDKYSRFMFNGINKGLKPSEITINSIMRNLCSTEFNNSLIIPELFKKFDPNYTLNSDFLGSFEQHLKDVENNRKRELADSLFANLDYSAITYLEEASKYIKQLISKYGYDSKDAATISLFLAIDSLNGNTPYKSNVLGFFGHNNITVSKVLKYVGINRLQDIKSEKSDIDLIASYLSPFIPNKPDKNVKVEDIVKSIFDVSIHNSTAIKKMLGSSDSSYDLFADFEVNFGKYVEQIKDEEKRQQEEDFYNKINKDNIDFVNNLYKLHVLIERQVDRKEVSSTLVIDKDAIPAVAVLINLLMTNSKSKQFLVNNGLKLDTVLALFGIRLDGIDGINGPIDYDLMLSKYSNLINKNAVSSVDDIAKKLFGNLNSFPIINRVLSTVSCDTEVLKTEISTGKEYVPPISDEDRFAMFSNEPVKVLSTCSLTEFICFGDSLDKHAKFVSQKIDDLRVNENSMKAVANLKRHANQLIIEETVEPEKKSALLAFFRRQDNTPRVEKRIDKNAVKYLEKELTERIDELSRQLEGYTYIQKYLIVFISQVKSHIIELKVEEKRLKELATKQDPSTTEGQINIVDITTKLRFIENKLNYFIESVKVKNVEFGMIGLSIVSHINLIERLRFIKGSKLRDLSTNMAISAGLSTQSDCLSIANGLEDEFSRLESENIEAFKEQAHSAGNLSFMPISLELPLGNHTLVKDGSLPSMSVPIELSDGDIHGLRVGVATEFSKGPLQKSIDGGSAVAVKPTSYDD